jgi:hypothetical protein
MHFDFYSPIILTYNVFIKVFLIFRCLVETRKFGQLKWFYLLLITKERLNLLVEVVGRDGGEDRDSLTATF